MSNTYGYGQAQPTDGYSEYNAISFMVRQLIAKISTMTPVRVVACTNSGGLSPVGTVDVQPLVSFLDGNGNATAHGVLFQLPYFRLQGGTNAVICDPAEGDIGYVMFADQDISSVVAAKGAANPGSLRKFDMSDGIYTGGILNGVPTQYVRFTDTGITLADANGNMIQMGPTGITVTGNLIVNNIQIGGAIQAVGGGTYAGNIATSGTVTAGSVSLSTHHHTGVTTGGGNTGGPV